MSYVIEREQAFLETEIVAVLRHRRRAVRSQLILRDGSLRYTLTRPRTLIRRLQGLATQHFSAKGGSATRSKRGGGEGERWPNAHQPKNR